MKIQCVLCKEIVAIGAFKPSSDGIRVSCAACDQEFFLPASGDRAAAKRLSTSLKKDDAAPDPADAGEPGDGDCPKCFQPVPDDRDSCPGCGLLRERFASFAAEAVGAAPPALESLWETCEDNWSDADNHERFIELAAGGDDYAYAARRYRQVIRRRPRDTIARLQLERITKMTEAALLARKVKVEDDEVSHYKGLMVMLGFLVLLGLGLGIWALTKMGS